MSWSGVAPPPPLESFQFPGGNDWNMISKVASAKAAVSREEKNLVCLKCHREKFVQSDADPFERNLSPVTFLLKQARLQSNVRRRLLLEVDLLTLWKAVSRNLFVSLLHSLCFFYNQFLPPSHNLGLPISFYYDSYCFCLHLSTMALTAFIYIFYLWFRLHVTVCFCIFPVWFRFCPTRCFYIFILWFRLFSIIEVDFLFLHLCVRRFFSVFALPIFDEIISQKWQFELKVNS